MKRVIVKNKIGDFCCPHCNKDLREVGILVFENGWTCNEYNYLSNGNFDDNDVYDSEMELERIECGNCSHILDIGNYWEAIPRRVEEEYNN